MDRSSLYWGCRARWESASDAMHLNSGVAFSNSDGEIGVGGSPWKKRRRTPKTPRDWPAG